MGLQTYIKNATFTLPIERTH